MYDDKEFQQADKELKIVVEKMQENLSDCRRMDVIESSKVKHPGTYAGFIEKIPYLKELGINAVEFLQSLNLMKTKMSLMIPFVMIVKVIAF